MGANETMNKKVCNYRSNYGLKHGLLAHIKHQAIKDPIMSSVKKFKQENQRYNLYQKTRNEKHINKRQPLIIRS